MTENLKKLCNAFGPSGVEDEVREIIINEIKDYCDSYSVDSVGNLSVFKSGKEKREKLTLFAAHMDEIGFMVRIISEDGYLYFDEIGGVSRTVVAGRRLRIRTDNGDRFGIVCAKAIHLQSPEERGVCVPINELYIDIGCSDGDSADKVVDVGDCAVFEPNYEEFGNGYIKSKALDDRAGCAILIELIKSELKYDTRFVFTVCEESGTRGAIAAAYGCGCDSVVVVEATTAADIGGVPKAKQCCTLGEGTVLSYMDNGTIYDKSLVNATKAAADEAGIKYQFKTLISGGNDSSAFQKAAEGKKVLAVSVPARYIHSACSVIKKSDLDETKKLCQLIIERGF